MVIGLMMLGCPLYVLPSYTKTPDDLAYIEKIKNQPDEIRFAKADEPFYWGRIHSFIGQYSGVKIQVITDYVLQTYNPIDYYDYGWYIIKTPITADSMSIKISCFGKAADSTSKSIYFQNAKICSRYVLTGEMPPNLEIMSLMLNRKLGRNEHNKGCLQ